MSTPKLLPSLPDAALGATAARELLHKKIKTVKSSFFLGLALFAAIYVFFLFHVLPLLTQSIALAGMLGFAFGAVYLIAGTVWSVFWALIVQLNLLVDDVAAWVQAILAQIVVALRTQFVSGVVIDLEVVESQVQTLVTEQTRKLLAEDNVLLPLVNEWAPIAAREGLRWTVMRVAGPLWSGNQITLDRLEKEAARLSIQETAASIRPWLRIAMGIVLALGFLLAAIPVGIAYGIAALL